MKTKFFFYLMLMLWASIASAEIQDWHITGRVAIVTPEGGDSASYRWTQQDKRFAIQFIAPLGAGSVMLNGYPGRVRFTNEKGQVFFAKTAETLLKNHLGWKLPVSNLYYWIRAEAAPNIPAATEYDDNHRLRTLKQEGWTIYYLDYTTVQETVLPKRLLLVHPNLKVKIFINRWNIKLT